VLLPTADCPLPTAYCPLSTAHCPLPTANCQLHTVHCPLKQTTQTQKYLYPWSSIIYNNMHQPTITLRPGTIHDLPILRHWDEQPHVMHSDPNDDWDWENELLYTPTWREQLMAELDGRPIGFIQIIDPALEETHYWGEVPQGLRAIDIWIGEAADLNKGYGTVMMRMAIERCFSDDTVQAILIDPLLSNTAAQRFYRRMGFVAVEERDFDGDRCLVMELKRG
jgi:aminoglycoside 6'-N-acetyltransferase